jgi:hypothetical protein
VVPVTLPTLSIFWCLKKTNTVFICKNPHAVSLLPFFVFDYEKSQYLKLKEKITKNLHFFYTLPS